ncbi:MAG: ABC transporter ATP-binding protein [Verrucomicrobiales bacterium]
MSFDENVSASPVVVRKVKKVFTQGSAEVTALNGVDLELGTGEFVAIMGASGSGKSTLLHAMAGLTEVDEGEVLVKGRDLAEMKDRELTRFRRDEIGLVFQAFNLIPTLSALENIELPVLGQEESGRKAASLLEKMGLGARASHKPDALSGGEQQRVAIARALISDPTVLLADEPTGSLDSVSGQQLCRLLRDLCTEEKRSIVVVTHEPRVAMWADRVLVLQDGGRLADFVPSGEHDAEAVAAQYQHALQSGEAVEA